MSATATGIADVLTVRPATTTASSEPGPAPAGDFGAMVALLQGATQPAPVPGATAAPDPVQAAPADAAASVPALPTSGATLPASVVPALAALEPASTVSATPADESRALAEYGMGDEGDGTSAHEAAGGPRRQEAEDAVPGADERASDELLSADAGAVTAAVPPAMPGFVMPLPLIVSAPPIASGASERDLAPALGDGSASPAASASQALSDASQPSGASSVLGSPASTAGAGSAAPGAFATALSATDAATDSRSVQEAGRSASASAGVPADQPRADRESRTTAARARTATASRMGADAGVVSASGEPVIDAAADAAARATAGRATGTASNDPESTSAGDAAARHAAASRSAAPARDASTVIQSEVASLRTLSSSSDPVLTASRDVMPAARRVRVDASRDAAARDAVLPAPARGVDELTMPGAAGVMSFDTSMSAARAMAADEPGRPDEVRAPVEQVAARLGELRTNGRHEFTMRLDPADLGGVTIDARLEGGRLTVHIRAEHGATQELLNETLPRLREALSQQGFVPEQLSVQLGFDGSGTSGGGAARDDARSFTAATPPGSPAPAPLRTPRVSVPTTVSGARGGLDVWA